MVHLFDGLPVTSLLSAQNRFKDRAEYGVGRFAPSPVLAQKLHSRKRNLFNNDPTRSI
jgi:hypothetical protein